MQLFVNCADGNTITIEAEPEWTVSDLKDTITLENGCPFNAQNLIVEGKVLDEKIELCDLGLENESNIDLIITMRGNVYIIYWEIYKK